MDAEEYLSLANGGTRIGRRGGGEAGGGVKKEDYHPEEGRQQEPRDNEQPKEG